MATHQLFVINSVYIVPESFCDCQHAIKKILWLPRLVPDGPGDWIARTIFDHGDPYFHLADLPLYITAQQRAAADFRHTAGWAGKAVLNVARMSRFFSNRTIGEYAADIWQLLTRIRRVPMRMEAQTTVHAPVLMALESQIEAGSAPGFKKVLTDWIAQGQTRIVFDPAKVDFIDSSGRGAILSVLKGGEGENCFCAGSIRGSSGCSS